MFVKKVKRLSASEFQTILAGKTTVPCTAVVKLYSNSCHLCHGLQAPYGELANFFSLRDRSIKFFAFNIDDVSDVEELIAINGVPTILGIKCTGTSATIKTLEEPSTPDPKQWYHVYDMRKFVEACAK
tara:strand:- start:243 stop:626 length:384 start_codon:yes stop_codon:yes gene_type:complete